MGLRINTNMAAVNAQRQLSGNQKRVEHAQAAMASGKRIVHASDDAAGLAIAENIRGQLVGGKMAEKNALNAKSLIQISEGGLNEVSNMLVRLRELGVQGASDTVSDVEREFLNQEAIQLVQEIDRIAESTRFGNKNLLNGTGEQLEFHVGAFGTDDNVITYDVDADARASTLGVDSINVITKGDSRDALTSVDEALVQLGKMRADFGAVQSRLDATSNSLSVSNENLAAAKSRIMDADIAHESAELASSQILQQAAVNVLASANQNGLSALKLIG